MRQRILLVAGWAAAAVVTSLVASGAVAVAGGQVADRPLRPLSASEVAALPVVLTEGGQVPCRPLASGGSERDTGAAPESVGPTGDGGSSAGDGTAPPDGEEVPIVQTQVVSVRGGSANVAAEDGEMNLLWAIARPGFSVDHGVDENGTLRVAFSCEDLDSVIEAWWDEETAAIAIDTFEDAQ